LYKRIQIGIDAFSLLFSLLVAVYLKKGAFVFPKTIYDFSFVLLLVGIWFLAANECKLYRNRLNKKFPEEVLFNIYAGALFLILVSSFLFLSKSVYGDYFRFSYFMGMHFTISVALKYIIRKKQHQAFVQGFVYDSMVIVGYNQNAVDFNNTISEHVYYGYKCVGIIDESPVKDAAVPYLGKLSQLEQVFQQQHIDDVLIALPNHEQAAIRKCIELCDQYHVRVRIMPQLEDLTSKTEEVDSIGLLSVINLNTLPLNKWENKFFKNIFDIFFSLLFLIFIGWWLLPIIWLLVRITSKGPVIYKQERWGINNTPIVCYKFRTMYVQDVDAFEQTSRNDPRITPLGGFLRKFSLDELPQFWNVLKGEMSIVGPRPHPTPMNIASMETVNNYLKRHIIKPGITGWAQINGSRGEVRSHQDMEQRVNFDLYYIHRWSFTLDLQIILQTIIKMLRDQGAY
jgi:putative colanic acid biosynthesis UDP-glucose lipid carrier transferase